MLIPQQITWQEGCVYAHYFGPNEGVTSAVAHTAQLLHEKWKQEGHQPRALYPLENLWTNQLLGIVLCSTLWLPEGHSCDLVIVWDGRAESRERDLAGKRRGVHYTMRKTHSLASPKGHLKTPCLPAKQVLSITVKNILRRKQKSFKIVQKPKYWNLKS